MQNICAGIVTYNPDVNLLNSNIKSIITQIDHLIVVDNGSKNVAEIKKVIDDNNIIFVANEENKGIASALNQLCEKTIELGSQWIMTLDQDSISPDLLVLKLAENIKDDVAIIAPNIVYKNNESFSDKNTHGIKEVEWVITSASLTNLSIWKKLGGFDEKLFIDGVDRDYGIRATRAGYKVLKCYDVKLLHELGNLKCRKRFGRTIYVTNHSAIRKYYMVRNVIYLDKKLQKHDSQSYILKLVLKTLFYEKNKVIKIKSIIHGIIDGLKMKP